MTVSSCRYRVRAHCSLVMALAGVVPPRATASLIVHSRSVSDDHSMRSSHMRSDVAWRMQSSARGFRSSLLMSAATVHSRDY